VQISVFENDETDFVIPCCLYETRLRQLEQALESTESVVVDAFFATQQEDEEFLSYQGNVSDTPLNHDTIMQPSLVGSGYHSVAISWLEEPSSIDYVSPWEISVRSPASAAVAPTRPRLDENDKRLVRDALNRIRSMEDVSECFGFPVSEAYSDYTCRVEIPMDLSFIADRIEADYYATKFSFLADLRLIMTNSVKYNGEGDSLSITAANMVEEVKKMLLDAGELEWFQEYEKPLPGSQPTGNLLQWEQAEASQVDDGAVSTVQQRRSRERQSSLEGPSSGPADRTRQSRRAARRPQRLVDSLSSPLGRPSRTSRRQTLHQRTTRATTRSVLEGPTHTLEQLSSRGGSNSRGRSPGYGRRGSLNPPHRRSTRNPVDNQRQFSRQSVRPGLRNSVQSTLVNESSIGQRISRPTRSTNPILLSSAQDNTSVRRSLQSAVEQAPFASSSSSSSEDANSEDGYSQNGASVHKSSDESEAYQGQRSLSGSVRSSRQPNSNGRVGQRVTRPTESTIDADDRRNSGQSLRKTSRHASRSGLKATESNDDSPGDAHEDADENESSFDGHGSDVDDESVEISAGDDDYSLDSPIASKRKRTAAGRRNTAKVNDTARPSRKRTRQPPEAIDDARKSRTRGLRASYEDPSSSEFNDESDEQKVPKRRNDRPPAAKKRKGNWSGQRQLFTTNVMMFCSSIER
jgi:Bromodomain